MRDTNFVLASVGVHLLVGGAAIVLHPKETTAASRTIVVEVRHRDAQTVKVTPPPVVPPRAPTPPRLPPPRTPARPPLRPVAPPPIAPPPVAPPVAPPPVAPPPPSTPNRKPNLFDAKALGAVVGTGTGSFTMRDSGGRTSSAAKGGRDPNQRDASGDQEGATSVIREAVADAQDKERLASGRVPPRWREVERVAYGSFHPRAETVTDEGSFQNFLKNWANTKPQGGKTPRGLDDSQSSAFLGTGAAGSTQSDVPEHMRKRTVIEVVVAPDGSILSTKIVQRSGRRSFDNEAMANVVEAVKKGGRLEGDKAVVTRWAVDAWVNVAPPTAAGGFTFEETTGKVSMNHPMKKSVQTKVALISFRTRD